MLSFVKETNKIISLKNIYGGKKTQKIILKFVAIAVTDHNRKRNTPNFVKHHWKSRVQSYKQKK